MAVLFLTAACSDQRSEREDERAQAVRFVIEVPAGRTLGTFALSGDGRWLAYTAETADNLRRHLFVRAIGDGVQDDRELGGTAGAANPFFSPDGSSLGYFSSGSLWRVAADGTAPPVRVADAPVGSAGGTWTADGRIVFAPLGNQGLVEVSAQGGAATEVTTLNPREGELAHGWPHAFAGGIVFSVSQRGRDPHVEVLSRDGRRQRLRVPVSGHVNFVSTGHLVFGYLGNLMTVRFDAQELQIQDVPVPIAKNLQTGAGFAALGRSSFAVSPSGTLVWVRAGREDAASRLVRVQRDGRYETLPAPAEVYQTPRLSPDGRRLAVVVRDGVMTREIRVLESSRAGRVLFTLRGGDNQSPTWMDNRRLAFGSNRDGLQQVYVASGESAVRPLFSAQATAPRNPAAWLRSPRLLALYEIDAVRRRDVLIYRVGESIVPVVATPANERSPVLSPDGKWIAYVSDT